MRQLVYFELLKLLKNKFVWLFLIAAVFFNVFLLWWVNNGDQYSPSSQEYRTVYTQIQDLPNDKKTDFLLEKQAFADAVLKKESYEMSNVLNYSADVSSSVFDEYTTAYKNYGFLLDEKFDYLQFHKLKIVYDEVLVELEKINTYSVFLSEIEEKALMLESISVFNSDTFSNKNILKTAEDFKGMENIKPEYGATKGLTVFLETSIPDVIMLMIIILFCNISICYEFEKDLVKLLISTQFGGHKTFIAKLCALVISVSISYLLILSSTLVFCWYSYGFGDVYRPIQSLPDLMATDLNFCVIEYVAMYSVLKLLGFIAVLLIVMFFSFVVRKGVLVVLASILCGSISYFVFYIIPITSVWNWFKIINPITLVNTNFILSRYFNLNFFGKPLNISIVYVIFLSSIIMGFALIDYYKYISLNYVVSHKTKNTYLTEKICKKVCVPKSIWYYEAKKIFVSNHVLLFILLFVVFQIFYFTNTKIYVTAEELYYKNYISIVENGISEQEELQLLSKNNFYDESDESAFLRFLEYYDYVKANSKDGAKLIYDTGYNILFNVEKSDFGRDSALQMLVILSLCLCGVFSFEHQSGARRLLLSQFKGGNYTVSCKIVISMCIVIVLFIITYTKDIFLIYSNYGLKNVLYPISSLPAFSTYPSNVSILEGVLLLMGMRLFVFLIVGLFLLAVSQVTKNYVFATALALFILILPYIIDSGDTLRLDMNYVLLHMDRPWIYILQSFILIFVSAFSLSFLYKSFAKCG